MEAALSASTSIGRGFLQRDLLFHCQASPRALPDADSTSSQAAAGCVWGFTASSLAMDSGALRGLPELLAVGLSPLQLKALEPAQGSLSSEDISGSESSTIASGDGRACLRGGLRCLLAGIDLWGAVRRASRRTVLHLGMASWMGMKRVPGSGARLRASLQTAKLPGALRTMKPLGLPGVAAGRLLRMRPEVLERLAAGFGALGVGRKLS